MLAVPSTLKDQSILSIDSDGWTYHVLTPSAHQCRREVERSTIIAGVVHSTCVLVAPVLLNLDASLCQTMLVLRNVLLTGTLQNIMNICQH